MWTPTSRVEAAATECQILISAQTYEITRDMTDAKFYPRGEFALKGVGEHRDCGKWIGMDMGRGVRRRCLCRKFGAGGSAG